MPAECRQHGLHAECTFTLQNAFLKLKLSVEPFLWQRAVPVVDVAHAVPRQERWSGEIILHVGIGESYFPPHAIPYRFLPGEGKRHVHSVESHPVDEALPLRPLPIDHSVAVGAVVEEESLLHPAAATHRLLHFGQP